VRRGESALGLGVFAGFSRYGWILDGNSRPEPAYTGADGSAWFEAGNGSLWYVDPDGNIFLLTHNRVFMALSFDGLLWTEAGGSLIAHTVDGSSLSLRSDGSLQAFDAAGNEWTVGEDGAYYAKGPYDTFLTLGPDGQYYTVDSAGERVSVHEAGRREAPIVPVKKARRRSRLGVVALLATIAMLSASYGTHTGPFQRCVKNGAGMKLCGGLAKAYCVHISDPLVGRGASCNRLLGEHARIGSGLDPSLR